jgi:hypothetical protein
VAACIVYTDRINKLTRAIKERTGDGLICKHQTCRYIALPVDSAVTNINNFAPPPMGKIIALRKKGNTQRAQLLVALSYIVM